RAGGGAVAVAEAELAEHADELVRLWGSDLRTHTTEARAVDGARRLGALEGALASLIARLEVPLVGAGLDPAELALFNPHTTPWAGWPMAVRVHFPPGLVHGGVAVDGLVAQAEEVERYRDGSVRRALLVMAPVIPPLGVLRLRCRSGPAPVAVP